jgi:hypothetical protein
MSAYIYTPRAEVKEMVDGEKVARMSFAYKDFDCYAPASWFRSAGAQESAGLRAASKHNDNGVRYLACCDKFEEDAQVYEVKGQMRLKYLDYDFGGMKRVGVLKKHGRKWYIKFNTILG